MIIMTIITMMIIIIIVKIIMAAITMIKYLKLGSISVDFVVLSQFV